jgi:hypothetical protein
MINSDLTPRTFTQGVIAGDGNTKNRNIDMLRINSKRKLFYEKQGKILSDIWEHFLSCFFFSGPWRRSAFDLPSIY